MKKSYERKFLDCKTLDVDKTKRQVKIAIAELESIDRDEDVFEPKAFDRTIKERGPKGTNEIWHLLDHTQKSFSALSKFSELYIDGIYVVGVSAYKDSFAWREVAWPLYESGDITQHSVGFTTLDAQPSKDKSHRIIKEVALWEGSAVLFAAQPNTPMLELIKGVFDDEMEFKELSFVRFERAIKRLKEDKFNDTNKSLLLIELLQLKDNFIDLTIETTTKPEFAPANTTSTLPGLVESIKNFRSQFKLPTNGSQRTYAATGGT